jgi:hypothetical protein
MNNIWISSFISLNDGISLNPVFFPVWESFSETVNLFPKLIALLLIFIFGYAEIHYRLPFLPSWIFKKEPEIIFDLPTRGQLNQQIPLFLFIKDAQRFPLMLERLTFIITPQNSLNSTQCETELNQQIQSKFFSRTFEIPADHFPQAGFYKVIAQLTCRTRCRKIKLKQDNYRGIPHDPFLIHIAADPLPVLPNCYWGDLHLHSNYTDDQVEFGAPIRETARCAKAMGLNFVAITDHSYDLDDKLDNYLENDPSLKKWQKFVKEVERAENYSPGFLVLGGEEVSAGNHRNENVHCLVFGNRTFYHGSGDGGELLLYNLPTHSLEQLYREVENAGEAVIIAAAHPFDKPPYAQRKLLNRGYWHKTDLSNPALDYWQIFNGRSDKYFRTGLEAWKETLLEGSRVGILGGTDAHGNFNCFRQVSIPFLTMIKHREQLLGQTRTGIFSEKPLSRAALLEALKQKRVIVSNGPAGEISVVQDGNKHFLGDKIKANSGFILSVNAASSAEFGAITSAVVHIGDYRKKEERPETVAVYSNAYTLQTQMNFAFGLPPGYLRLEVRADDSFCLTNPVWIG